MLYKSYKFIFIHFLHSVTQGKCTKDEHYRPRSLRGTACRIGGCLLFCHTVLFQLNGISGCYKYSILCLQCNANLMFLPKHIQGKPPESKMIAHSFQGSCSPSSYAEKVFYLANQSNSGERHLHTKKKSVAVVRRTHMFCLEILHSHQCFKTTQQVLQAHICQMDTCDVYILEDKRPTAAPACQ